MAITCDIPGCGRKAELHLVQFGKARAKNFKDQHTKSHVELCPEHVDRVGFAVASLVESIMLGYTTLPEMPAADAGEDTVDLSQPEAPEEHQESLPLTSTDEPSPSVGDHPRKRRHG